MECNFFPLSMSLALSLKAVLLRSKVHLVADFESVGPYGKQHGSTVEAAVGLLPRSRSAGADGEPHCAVDFAHRCSRQGRPLPREERDHSSRHRAEALPAFTCKGTDPFRSHGVLPDLRIRFY